MPTIKTLDDILADMTDISASSKPSHQHHKTGNPSNAKKLNQPKKSLKQTSSTSAQTSADTDFSPLTKTQLDKVLATTPKQSLVDADKTNQRLRWLAFYYLSKRELSQKELRQKLLAKNQDPKKVEELLTEFAQKGYQSDERFASMLIRESVRRGRGKQHIAERLRQHGIKLPYSLDELITKAGVDSVCDGTILDTQPDKETVDWLRLAVEARSKKYGDELPTDPKQKAKQLRFLQYRGFDMQVCFDALKFSLQDLDER